MSGLNWILGDCGTGKTQEIARRIHEDIKAERRAYLIVPEQQAVSSEIFMIDNLPDEAPLYFEVTNFTRLADTVFRMVGGLALASASPEVEQLIMWRTLMETYPLLHNKPAKIDGATVGAMRATVRELRTMRLRHAELSEAILKVEDSSLKKKLQDYALVSSVYHDLLTESYADASDRLDRLADLLRRYHPLAGAHIYVDGFSSFTEQEYTILGALLDTSPMTVTLSIPPEADKQLCVSEVEETIRRMDRLARERSLPVTREQLGVAKRAAHPALRYVAERMYRVDYASLPPYEGEATDALALVEAPDPIEASLYVAADIKRRVAEGARYHDFTIICSSLASYEGILDSALEGAAIPHFLSSRTQLLTLEPIKMIFSAYEVIVNKWRCEDVIGYLKCGLAGVDAATVDEIESYTEMWDITDKRFTNPEGWHRSPDGLGEIQKDRQAHCEAFLERINRAREGFVPPLLALGEVANAPLTVAEHIRALTEFLLKIEFPANVAARSALWQLRRDHRKAEEYSRLWDLLCDALDALSDVLGDLVLSANDFSSVLRLLFESADMGHIPARMDEVMVGQASLIRSEGKQYVYLLGVNENEFPSAVRESNTFTEVERDLLSQAGFPQSDTLDVRSSRELFAFYRALTLAEKGVTLIWNRLNPSFSATEPSDAIKRIRALLPSTYPVLVLSQDNLLDRLYTPSMAYGNLGRLWGRAEGAAIREALSQDPVYASRVEAARLPLKNVEVSLSPDTAAAACGERMSLSKSRIEQYAKCPLSYFCKYILKLDSGEKAEFNAANIGTFIHEVLECFLTWCRENKIDFRKMAPDEVKREVSRVAEEVLCRTVPKETREDPRNRHLFDDLILAAYRVTVSMCREFADSDFEPALFEVNITDKDPTCPSPYTFTTPSGRTIYITGIIDRVDTYTDGKNTYVRVVDYKTGKQEFDLNKMDLGLDLQLFLYLISLWKSDAPAFRQRLEVPAGGEILPAGMMYFSSLLETPTKKNFDLVGDAIPTTLDMAIQGMAKSGLLLYDEELLTHMDKTPGHKHLFLASSGGKYTDKALRSLKTLEELGEMIHKIGEVMAKIGGGMESGMMDATPLKQPKGQNSTCEYCPYKVICRNAKVTNSGF